jgi:hypothetical protein
VNLANGTATVTIPANSLPLGSVTILASYSGDSNYQFVSGNASVTVNSAATLNPTVTVTPPSGILTAYPFSITVTVSGPSGDAAPTGSVSLQNQDYTSNSQTLVGGKATFTVQGGMEGGANKFTANYPGDSNYAAGSGTGPPRPPSP